MFQKPQVKREAEVVMCCHSGWAGSSNLIIWYLPLSFKQTEGIFLCMLSSARMEAKLTENNDDFWVTSVPTVCVTEQVAAPLPGWWDYQGGGQEDWEEGRVVVWRVGAVHHTVRKHCRHQAPSPIYVWNPRRIRMGSTIKWNKDSEREWGGTKRSASNGAVHGSQKMLPHFWLRLLSDTDDHSARREVIPFHKETPSSRRIDFTSRGSGSEGLLHAQQIVFVTLHCRREGMLPRPLL